jgi:hypothetical protein
MVRLDRIQPTYITTVKAGLWHKFLRRFCHGQQYFLGQNVKMPGEEEGHTLRRSTRKRKEISYKDLISPAAEDNTSPEPDFIDENDDDEPTFKPINKKQSLRNTTTSEIPSTKVDNKRSANAHTTKEGRLHSMGGTDESIRIIVQQRLEKWRDVLRKVHEELFDYTIGWGICTGDWNGEGGTRQKMEILDLSFL